MGRLTGQTALVTGASKGIGRACALALAAEGAGVGLVARHQEGLEAVLQEIERAGGRGFVAAADVSDEARVAPVFDQVEQRLGPVSILVNNAGTLEKGRVAELPTEAFDRTMDVNLRAPFLWAREAVRRMVPRRRGRILFVSSISSTLGTPGASAYNASKWALNGLIKSLAEEAQGHGRPGDGRLARLGGHRDARQGGLPAGDDARRRGGGRPVPGDRGAAGDAGQHRGDVRRPVAHPGKAV
ncbi:MAG: SDR family NAD(P)-dependent oxidoreductase [Myxococcales bacterium]